MPFALLSKVPAVVIASEVVIDDTVLTFRKGIASESAIRDVSEWKKLNVVSRPVCASNASTKWKQSAALIALIV